MTYIERKQFMCIPDVLRETYLLLTIGIMVYFMGCLLAIPAIYSITCICLSFFFLFMVIATYNPIMFVMYSFMMGLSHNAFFQYINFIDEELIMQALFMVLIIFAGLSYFAHYCPDYDQFYVYGLLFSVLYSLIMAIIFNIFLRSTLLEIGIVCCSLILFSVFIIVDTKELINRRCRNSVEGALNLFLDFINLFINMIKLLRYLKKKN